MNVLLCSLLCSKTPPDISAKQKHRLAFIKKSLLCTSLKPMSNPKLSVEDLYAVARKPETCQTLSLIWKFSYKTFLLSSTHSIVLGKAWQIKNIKLKNQNQNTVKTCKGERRNVKLISLPKFVTATWLFSTTNNNNK